MIKDNLASINRMESIADPSIQSLASLFIEDGKSGKGVGMGHLNRLEIKIRTSEGQQGNIQLLILPQKSNMCQSLEIPLKPLNLH